MSELLSIQKQTKQRSIIKPHGNGMAPRIVTVGLGIASVYTFWNTSPVMVACGIGAVGFYAYGEIRKVQSPERSQSLKDILTAGTVRHPSINEARKELVKKYPAHAINEAIEHMIPHCKWVEFMPGSKHELAPFRVVYCYEDPADGPMTPLQGVVKFMQRWGIEQTVDTATQEVGADTKLNAIAVPTLQVDSPYQIANPIEVIGDLLYSMLVIAPPGSGKGMIISNLMRQVKRLHPEIKFFAFDGKNDPNETGYWSEGFDGVVRINLDREGFTNPVEVAQTVETLIGALHSQERNTVLILDELNALIDRLDIAATTLIDGNQRALCKRVLGMVKGKISTSASTGNSRNNFVWGVGQSPNLKDLGLTGGNINQLLKLAIAVPEQSNHTKQLVLNTAFTGTKQAATVMDDIKYMMRVSPVKRAFYVSSTDQWYPMAVLPNYSGYDRDTESQCAIPPTVGLNKSVILVGHGSESETVLQQRSTPTQIQQPNATQLQEQGLLYSPTVIQEEPKLETGTAIAAPEPQPPNNVVPFPAPAEPDSPLKQVVKELVQKLNALPPELSKHAQELKPKFQELIRDRRDDLLWIIFLSAEKGEVKAADISRNLKYKPWFKELEASGINTSEAIRGKFSELSDRGIGDCFGEGNKLTYLLFSGDDRTLTIDPVETLEGIENSGEDDVLGV